MIQPTIGRVILYWPATNRHGERPAQPWAALVAFVCADGRINVGGFKANGDPFKDEAVQIVQPDQDRPSDDAYCEWMGYQLGQAEKAREAQAELTRFFNEERQAQQQHRQRRLEIAQAAAGTAPQQILGMADSPEEKAPATESEGGDTA